MLLGGGPGAAKSLLMRADGRRTGTSGSGIFGGGAGGPNEGIDFRGSKFGFVAKALPSMMGTVVALVLMGPFVVVVLIGRILGDDVCGGRN
jgi:hypothetical protein